MKFVNNLSPSRTTENLELVDIIDVQTIRPLMDDFYKLVHTPIGINDLKGNVLVGVGWQDICTKFHRVHPEACKHCIESDTKLSASFLAGEFKLYKCKNNMWDMATPIIVAGQHVGYVFSGQFFFEEEPLDYELFRSQARQYGFNEEEYIAALERVPRLSREAVDTAMSFLMTFTNMVSQLGYRNLKLAQLLEERDKLVNALEKNRKDLDRAQSVGNIGSWRLDLRNNELTWSDENYCIFGIPKGVPLTYETFLSTVHPEDREYVDMKWNAGLEGEPYDIEHRIIADGKIKWVREKAYLEFDKDGTVIGGFGITQNITERKEAEEALRLSNIYNRSLIEASMDPLVTIGLYGKITDVNSSTETITGYSRNNLIGTYFSDYFTEPEKAKEGYLHVFKEGFVRDYPLEIKHKNGHVTPVLYNASVYKDESGKVIGVFASARDITKLKQAEKALKKAHDNLEKMVEERTAELEKAYNSLKESEKSLSEAQRIAHIGSWNWDLVTNKVYWSDELYRIFGRSTQEPSATYGEFLSYVHPDDRDPVGNVMKKGLNGETIAGDYRIILANGEERIVHTEAEVVYSEENNPIQVKGTVQDITERKKAEEKIQYLANIVESSKDAIVTVSLDGIVTSWNKGAEQIFGYAPEEILGKKVSILEPDNLRGEIKQLIEMVKQGEKVKHYETSRLKKDGTIIIVSGTLSPVLDTSRKLVAISVIVRDITERKEAEEAMVNIEIARKKEIHHRIKNNLQVISSLLDLQAEKFNNREYVKNSEIIESFRESQDRVTSIALIHEELHEEEGTTDTLNFSLYLHRLVESLFQTYRFGNIEIYLNLGLEENIFFGMDTAVPLGMIVNELVSNSLKYAFSGRKTGEIQIKLFSEEIANELSNKEELKQKDTKYTLIVSDNGTGIPKNINFKNSGTLGLQLVNLLVDQLDGTIELKRDNGTEFVIKFSAIE